MQSFIDEKRKKKPSELWEKNQVKDKPESEPKRQIQKKNWKKFKSKLIYSYGIIEYAFK